MLSLPPANTMVAVGTVSSDPVLRLCVFRERHGAGCPEDRPSTITSMLSHPLLPLSALISPPYSTNTPQRSPPPKLMARIGMKRDGADEIRAHPFFNGFVWEKLVGKTYKAPW